MCVSCWERERNTKRDSRKQPKKRRIQTKILTQLFFLFFFFKEDIFPFFPTFFENKRNAAVDRNSNHRVVSLSKSHLIWEILKKIKTQFLASFLSKLISKKRSNYVLCVGFSLNNSNLKKNKIVEFSRERVRVFLVQRVDPTMDNQPERRDIAFRRRQRRPERLDGKKRRRQRWL